MSSDNSKAIDVAREYYNSEDADAFYSTIWGGEDIHVGIYLNEDDPISESSQRTQEKMLEHIDQPGPDTKIIDLGSGYAGSARYLADRFGCKVVALNLSEVENERGRELNREQGLDHLIDVVDGNFEELPYKDGEFDIVMSQDAFLHSPDRDAVIREAARVLKSGGEMVFTDPMQSDDCPEGVLDPILKRIHLENMASPGYYTKTAEKYGLELVEFEDLTIHLRRHYASVLRETERQNDKLEKKVSKEYIQNMKNGLKHWVEGADKGHLSWGILHFRKK